MEIKWPNVVAFALAIVAFFMAVSRQEEIATFLGSTQHLGSSPSITDRMHGLMAFGLMLVALLGVLRIVLNSQNGKH